MIDIGRLLACLGVIWIHIDPKTEQALLATNYFSKTCVSFFYCISLFYFLKNIDRVNHIKNSLTRLIYPYSIWNLIYILIWIFKSEVIGINSFKINLYHAIFFGTSSEHMYFIPTLIFFQCLSFYILQLFRKNSFTKFSLYFLGALGIALFGWIAEHQHAWGWRDMFLKTVVFSLPGIILNRFPVTENIVFKYFLSILSILLFIYCYININTYPSWMDPGLFFCIFCICFPFSINKPAITKIASVFFPVYLVHVFILGIFTFAFKYIFHINIIFNIFHCIIYSSFIFCISFLFHNFLENSLPFYQKIFTTTAAGRPQSPRRDESPQHEVTS